MPRCCINFSLKATHIFHRDYMSRFYLIKWGMV
nr:MAG TPA: hypothetical protein [Caudoviricetes sp.]